MKRSLPMALLAALFLACGSAPEPGRSSPTGAVETPPPAEAVAPPAIPADTGEAAAPSDPGDAAVPSDPGAPAAVGEPGVRLPRVDEAIEGAIARGVTPGAVVVIGGTGGTTYVRGYGALDWAPGSARAGDSTLYDVASLTKVVGTTSAVMLLVERGRMGLDDPLSRHLSTWPRGGWRDEVTIRRLLTHSAGLGPFVRFWHPSAGSLRGREAVLEAIAALPSSYRPGAQVTYSDLGFILLGAAVEEVAGTSLDMFLERELWTPLGMADTGFNPLGRAGPERIAPTEVDEVFRHTHVHGVVHDENAYAMGGVAGHAGLFSTAADLARFAHHLLRTIHGDTDSALPVGPATAARFTARQPSGRALGWDAAPGSGQIARALSPRAFGHTGFTGTSLWFDPDLDLFVLLLTNRVNPTREGTGIADLRRTVHELAARAAAGGS